MKKIFEEPEIQVIKFSSEDTFIVTSNKGESDWGVDGVSLDE